mmetsp:Transcript_16311/g.13980  ORF Transcript_16311/g.13980 Transcript_16311/m.13980 type:complete len:80 (-) Transcript_16311:4319-4558(-)
MLKKFSSPPDESSFFGIKDYKDACGSMNRKFERDHFLMNPICSYYSVVKKRDKVNFTKIKKRETSTEHLFQKRKEIRPM